MCLAGETACATNDKSFACIGGACFSLPTPACGRIFSRSLTVAALMRRLGVSQRPSEPRSDYFIIAFSNPSYASVTVFQE
jgi:hypothetical protein